MADRAVNMAVRVQGVAEAQRDFMAVGQAATKSIDQIAAAAKAQAGYEAAVARSSGTAAAYGAAQAAANQELATAKTALKAGEISQEQYNTAVLQTKNSLALVKAEHAAATGELNNTAKALTVARGAANDLVPALDRGTAAHGRMSASSMIMMHSVRSAADSFAAGLPPVMIFSEQLARLGEAAALSGGGTGALGAMGEFMAGPWGIAVLGGVAVLGTIIGKMDLFGNATDAAADKIKKQATETEAARVAQMAYDTTIDGSIVRERKLNDELEKRIKNQAQLNAQQTGQVAAGVDTDKSNQSAAQTAFARTQRLRDEAEAALRSPAAALPGAMGGFQAAFQSAERNFAKAQADLITANAAVLEGERNLRAARAIELQDQAKGLADPKLGARQALEAKQGTLTDTFAAGLLGEGAYKTQFAELQKQIDALGKSAKETAQFLMPVTGTITGHFGDSRPGHTHAGLDIAVPVGTGVHAPQAGVVIEAGTLPGYGNVIFIDHGGGTITRFGHLSKLDVAKGQEVSQGQIIGLSGGARGAAGSGDSTGPHLHYEVRVGGKAVNPATGRFPVDSMGQEEKSQKLMDEAARAAKAAHDKAVSQQKASDDLSARLDNDLLAAKRANLTDAEQIAQIARDQVNVEAKKLTDDIAAQAATNPIIAAKKDQLDAEVEQARIQKLATIDLQEERRKAADAFKVLQATNDNQLDILHLQESLTTTAQERRDVQLRILGIEKEEERRALERQRDDLKADPADRQNAAARLGSLDQRYDLKTQGAINSTRSPLEDYLAQNDPKLIGDKVQRAYVAELESVRAGIDDAIDNALGIQDPFLKSLVDLFIQQVLIDPIAHALQGAMGGSGGGGFFGQLLGGIGGIFGGGGGLDVAGAVGGVSSTLDAIPAIVPFAFAGGTDRVPVGADFYVGDNGRERMRMHPGGRLEVINGPASHRMANDNAGITVVSNYYVPERADSRATRSSVARGQQLAIGRTIRKGLG